MKNEIYFQQNCKNTRKTILERFPNATNLKLGDNNIVKGYWFNLPHGNIENCEWFKPLNQSIKIN